MGMYGTYYSDMVNRPTCVYRIYDNDEQLLYVGITKNVLGRMTKHKRREWWPLARYMEITWFEGREAAKSAERHAIRDENPIHNITRPRVECC